MTQKDKDLLFQDLSARLPYGVKVEIKYYDNAWELLAIYTNGTTYATRDIGYPIETYFEDCKPYLFPLLSMSEEERMVIGNEFAYGQPQKAMDILHKRHIDFNGLIPRGLAIDATGKGVY